MPYREKIAWLSLLAIAVTYGPYFTLVMLHPAGAVPDFHQLGAFAKTALSQMVILGLGTLFLRWRAPEDARMPLDERDRAIASRARTIAYYVLMGGMIWVAVVMPFYSNGWVLVNSGLFMIVFAEIISYGMIALGYHRNA